MGITRRTRRPSAHEVERAASEAEALYQNAVVKYRRAVSVLCNPRVTRAARSLEEAGRMVERAMRVLARPTCRRLGLVVRRDAGTLCDVLHYLGRLDPRAADSSPAMLEHVHEELPKRRLLDEWLVRDGRRVLDEFARAGRLDLESSEGRRLRALLHRLYSECLPDEEPAPALELVAPARRRRRPVADRQRA